MKFVRADYLLVANFWLNSYIKLDKRGWEFDIHVRTFIHTP